MTIMAYVENKNGFQVGDWATTTRQITCLKGSFEEGTRVKVVGVSDRGYDLEDEIGNRITETGFRSIQ